MINDSVVHHQREKRKINRRCQLLAPQTFILEHQLQCLIGECCLVNVCCLVFWRFH